jgi:hypothetical protein
MPRTENIQVVNDLTSAAATVRRAGDERGRTPDLAGLAAQTRCSKMQHRPARQLHLARERLVLDAAESFLEA